MNSAEDQRTPQPHPQLNAKPATDQGVKKRKTIARRPLSCTECKRRKTKCSSLGVTPCEACVRRGYPDDCRWGDEGTVGAGVGVVSPSSSKPLNPRRRSSTNSSSAQTQQALQQSQQQNQALTIEVQRLKKEVEALQTKLTSSNGRESAISIGSTSESRIIVGGGDVEYPIAGASTSTSTPTPNSSFGRRSSGRTSISISMIPPPLPPSNPDQHPSLVHSPTQIQPQTQPQPSGFVTWSNQTILPSTGNRGGNDYLDMEVETPSNNNAHHDGTREFIPRPPLPHSHSQSSSISYDLGMDLGNPQPLPLPLHHQNQPRSAIESGTGAGMEMGMGYGSSGDIATPIATIQPQPQTSTTDIRMGLNRTISNTIAGVSLAALGFDEMDEDVGAGGGSGESIGMADFNPIVQNAIKIEAEMSNLEEYTDPYKIPPEESHDGRITDPLLDEDGMEDVLGQGLRGPGGEIVGRGDSGGSGQSSGYPSTSISPISRAISSQQIYQPGPSKGPSNNPPTPTSHIASTYKNILSHIQFGKIHPNLLDASSLLETSDGGSGRRDALLAVVFAAIPEDEIAQSLVEIYLEGPFRRSWVSIHRPTFRQEVARFFSKSPPDRYKDTDPAWLSILLMVFVYGMYGAAGGHSVDGGVHARRYYEASRMALEAARWGRVPQIRHLQVTLLYIPYLFHFAGTGEDINGAINHLAAAITTVQAFNLDKLKADGSNLPLNDLAFKENNMNPRLAFHICQCLFHWYNAQDAVFCKRDGDWRMSLLDPAVATKLPDLLNDDDFLASDDPPPRPEGEFTNTTVCRAISVFGTHVRSFTSLHLGKKVIPYDEVLRFDEVLRRDALPRLPSPLLTAESEESFNFMQIAVYCSMHNRILRAHRPYMARAYLSPQYQASKTACIEAAKQILLAETLYMRYPQLRPAHHKRWILGSAIVLAVDLVISLYLGTSETDFISKRGVILQALAIFQQDNPEDKVKRMTVHCEKTVVAMLTCINLRWDVLRRGESLPTLDLEGFLAGVSTRLRSPNPTSTPTVPSAMEKTPAPHPPAPPPMDFDVEMHSFFPEDSLDLGQYDWMMSAEGRRLMETDVSVMASL